MPTRHAEAEDADAALLLQYEMTDIVREEMGLHEQEAMQIAQAIVRGMRKRYGGQRLGGRGHIYVPAPSKAERNEAIRREFNGNNYGELMQRHGIKRSQLYKVLDPKQTSARIGVSGAKAPAHKSPIPPHENGRQAG